MMIGISLITIAIIVIFIILFNLSNKKDNIYKDKTLNNKMNVKNLVFGIVIFILTTSVGIYGINTFYQSAPEYDDYCLPKQIMTEQDCISQNGTWNYYNQEPVKEGTINGYCDVYSHCQNLFEEAQKKYSRGAFFIALPLGIVVIAIGGLVFGLEFVGAGLMFGGVGIIIYGIVDYWRFADDWLKFILSAIGLVVVIALAYYLNKRISNKHSKS